MESNCAICLEQLKYPLGRLNNCKHKFCFKCIRDWLKKRSQCPLCGGEPKYLIKIEETKNERKVPVKKRTKEQFENELLAQEQLENDQGGPSNEDITIEYANCRSCRSSDNEHLLLLCDGNIGQNADGSTIRCNVAYHCYCLPEKLERIPENDWFCPFCENKPENAQHFVEQTNLNVSRSEEAGSSSSRQLKNETDVSKCHLSGCLEQGNMKIETGCSKIRNSESTLIQDAYGDSDTESESRDYSNEKSELYSTSDATSDDYDDSNEITVENTGGTNFDVLDDDDDDDDDDSDDGENDDDDDCNESDETDSEQKFHQAIFCDNCRRRRGMKRNQGITYRR
ncbi:Uncharacterized protein BM_BM18013 [Brugia malayi]|uniref:RING-type domain-containing protein n=1 Tax=Brugia malayi TaxID=6279 RepID=A0A4E9EZ64_BRUMA|nr:Uncharacterized protein BM_BM18013 [Brugia malayi]VIO88387.1 Uncharacterized protein BM_BM18013 [Brugia malayi]